MNNLIPAVGKMVPTPRTDAEEFSVSEHGYPPVKVIPSRLGKSLERELAAANARVKELEEVNEHLRSVGDELDDLVVAPSPNCSCHISPPCNDCVQYGGIREVKENWKGLR